MDLKATVLTSGDLEITLWDETERDELEGMLDEKTDMDIMLEGFEHYFTNGSYHPFDAGAGNPNVGLTDADCIAESIDFDDNGDAGIIGAFWYDPHSAIRSSMAELFREGRVVFTLA